MITTTGQERSVVVTGGGGRLGSAVARQLATAGVPVTAVDIVFPAWQYDPALGIRCLESDVLSARAPRQLRKVFSGAVTVLHLAGLHGKHLRQGARSADLWQSNVHGTRQVTEAAVAAGTHRMVLASTTALYGPGSPDGSPAFVLDEQSRPNPDNPYATAKLAAENVMVSAADGAMQTVALRFGRFYREDERAYQIRKLSTGLDLADALDALVAVCDPTIRPAPVYCVASDLPLARADRERLGRDCHAVLDEHLPGFLAAARVRGWDIPARVGRSVDSTLLQTTTGYRPRRSLAAVHEQWRSATPVVAGRRYRPEHTEEES